jgi:hypothetical protein
MEESDLRIEAKANAIRCRNAMWGGQPCKSKGYCPFGRIPPQKPSDTHCWDVTEEMWHEVLQKKREEADGEV